MADLNEVLLSVLSTIRVPKPGDRVHKDECAFSFDSPESEGGLYVCMSTFLGFGKQFVERHYRKTGQRAYLHIKRTRKPKEEEGGSGSGDPPRKKPTRLAIGVEGGFEVSSEHAQFEEEVKLVILPERLEVTSEDLSSMPDVVRERVSLSLSGILSSDSASHQDEVQQWDGEVRLVSKHAAGLQQLDSGLRIPPSGWRCQVCDLDENLWMNLTDGAILCGRRYFDGSGGNNHAMQHYRETGFPLAVKLGTITPAGADVYSYDEDDMVLDPGLPAHLAHFGIDMMQMQKSFRFLVEERIHCLQSDKVKYTQRAESLLQLPVPLEHATNKEELSEYEQKKKEAELAKAPPPELVRAHIPFAACLSALSEPETLEEFWSSALQAKSMASKTTRFASFPDYLVIQIKKFTFGLDWVPKKLDVSIEMPDSLDVSSLRGAGLQPGEEELPDLAPPSLITPDVEVKAPVLDESVITQLAEMGFPVEACRKAVFYTGNTGAEAAMNWVMTHMDDPDFSAPLVLPGFSPAPTDMPTPQGTPDPPPSEEHLATIISMGFSRDQASRALRATSNSLERAVDWIFSHIDDLDAMDISEGRSAAESVSESVPAGPRVRDGEGKYELFAFISHMGTSTMCGHYVCHIKKEGRWVIYNDQKVCASEKPPKDLGYIYFYQRASS
ncbi:Ubiquitin carboxyl-terminal hydrolase 5 [Acipenser ruthenus]|uniref:ubiquitinyl hydrolase 1 n=1 Tax=Acipenser ruthenus TaxID=7906 RepID=A0A662YLN8_ACIRT|nr:Ubiquitin carboxyl-terminal hydrolase 5 [Acipenser ruthenus]